MNPSAGRLIHGRTPEYTLVILIDVLLSGSPAEIFLSQSQRSLRSSAAAIAKHRVKRSCGVHSIFSFRSAGLVIYVSVKLEVGIGLK